MKFGSFTTADCHPVVRRPFDPPPKSIDPVREGIGPGSSSFMDIVKKGAQMADRRGGSSGPGATGPAKAIAQKANYDGARKTVSVAAKESVPAPRPTKSTASTATSSQVQSSRAQEVELEQPLDPR